MHRNLLIVCLSTLALMLAACTAPAVAPQAPADAAATDTPQAVETPPEEIPGGEDDIGEQEAEDGTATPAAAEEGAAEAAVEGEAYTAMFIPMNEDQATENAVTGSASITVAGDLMTVTVMAQGVAPGISHLMHIHGMVDGTEALCPAPDADRTGDAIIDLLETQDAAGLTLIPLHDDPASLDGLLDLSRFPVASEDGGISYMQTVSLSALEQALQESEQNISDLALEQRVIFIHGIPEEEFLPASVQSESGVQAQHTIPIACAEITRQEGTDQAEIPTEDAEDAQGEAPATPTPAAEEAALMLTTTESEEFGTYIATADGRPVYLFTPDSAQMSACYDDCAAAWPPVTVESLDQIGVGEQLDRSLLSTLEREDGAMQLVYNGHPLYYFVRDEGAQAPQGQDIHSFDGEWYLLTAEGTKLEAEG